jgi:2-oxoglutarate dehydrogenase E2 component (dihydrolipoamide succinyltransferase)
VQNRKLGQSISITQAVSCTVSSSICFSVGDEIIQMDRMRKMIAERMVDSKRISPHVTSFVEADMLLTLCSGAIK